MPAIAGTIGSLFAAGPTLVEDPVLVKMHLASSLLVFPGWVKVGIDNSLEASGIADNRRLGGLGTRQLDEVRRAVAG